MDMDKELCVIQANCQADGLVRLLSENKDLNSRFSLRRYTNFLHESVPHEELASCTAFIYQHLGEKWAEISSINLLKQVNPRAKLLQISNMMFKGYRPFWTNRGPSEFGDSFLDQLIAMKLNKPELIHIYLNGNLEKKFDLRSMFKESLEIERQKKVDCIVQTVDHVPERFREEQVFYLINHPDMVLLGVVAKKIFREPELPLPNNFEVPDLYPELTIPIHPQLAKIHGLKLVDENTKYNVFGKMKTCAEYTSIYIDSQILNMQPLTAYLHLV